MLFLTLYCKPKTGLLEVEIVGKKQSAAPVPPQTCVGLHPPYNLIANAKLGPILLVVLVVVVVSWRKVGVIHRKMSEFSASIRHLLE